MRSTNSSESQTHRHFRGMETRFKPDFRNYHANALTNCAYNNQNYLIDCYDDSENENNATSAYLDCSHESSNDSHTRSIYRANYPLEKGIKNHANQREFYNSLESKK